MCMNCGRAWAASPICFLFLFVTFGSLLSSATLVLGRSFRLRVQLLLSGATSSVLGCNFCTLDLLLPRGATFVLWCYFSRRVLRLSLGATFAVGCFFCPRVLAYLLSASMTVRASMACVLHYPGPRQELTHPTHPNNNNKLRIFKDQGDTHMPTAINLFKIGTFPGVTIPRPKRAPFF